MSKKSLIDSVEVGSPCSESWEMMTGNDRVRFCSHCSKSVNNLSELTRKEATRMIRANGYDICIRYTIDPRTKRPVFAKPLMQITRRLPSVAAGVMTASIGLGSSAYAQSSASVPAIDSRVAVVKTLNDEKKNDQPSSSGSHVIKGTLTDSNGAVIPGAVVSLFGSRGLSQTVTDGEGAYRFVDLEEGTYRIEWQAQGFSNASKEVTIEAEDKTDADASLEVGAVEAEVTINGEVEAQVLGGAMVMIEYSSPLSRAVADEDVDAVRELLAGGAKVNAEEQSYSRITPLFVAVEHGNVEIVRMLLEAGAKPNARTEDKQTPLMRLDGDASAELVYALVSAGADVNAVDDEQNTSLILAARYSPADALTALINSGANVNAQNKDGLSPLMAASGSDELESVRVLLAAGANPNLLDSDCRNAWHYADDKAVKDLLISYGADHVTGDDDEPVTGEDDPPRPAGVRR